MRVDDATQEQLYAGLAREIQPRLEALAQCRSTAEMEAHPAYLAIAPLVARSLATPHIADFRQREAPPRSRYRVLAWNIERGIQFEAQLEAFRSHSYLVGTLPLEIEVLPQALRFIFPPSRQAGR